MNSIFLSLAAMSALGSAASTPLIPLPPPPPPPALTALGVASTTAINTATVKSQSGRAIVKNAHGRKHHRGHRSGRVRFGRRHGRRGFYTVRSYRWYRCSTVRGR